MTPFVHPRLKEMLQDLGLRTGSRALEHIPAFLAMEAAARDLPVLHLQAAPSGLQAVMRRFDQSEILSSDACQVLHEQIRAPGAGRIQACYDTVVACDGREALLEEKSCVSEDGVLPDEIVLRSVSIEQAAAAIALQADREGLGQDLRLLADALPPQGNLSCAQAREVLEMLSEMGPTPALVVVASRDRRRTHGMRLLVLDGPAVAAAYAGMVAQDVGTDRASDNVRRILRTAAGLWNPPCDNDRKLGSIGRPFLRGIPGIQEGSEILDRAEANALEAMPLGDRPVEAAGLEGNRGWRALQSWIETAIAEGRALHDVLAEIGIQTVFPEAGHSSPRCAATARNQDHPS
jgi:hypothetical protein